ncbi:MAG: NTP transferase domain-containing protein [Stomatobaculum sp.]|nr:NTP transferase domain-containing protein [Stomatobaculum sp.]
MRILCIIMASGEGKRFGGNKLLASFRGASLFQNILQVTAPLFQGSPEDRLVVTRHMEIASWCRGQGVRVLLHDLPDRNQAIRMGLTALNCLEQNGTSGRNAADPSGCSGRNAPAGCLFCLSDQPLITEKSLRRMMEAFEKSPDRIIRLVSQEHAGSPVLFPAALFPELAALPPRTGGKEVIHRHPDLVTEVQALFPGELEDVDTPEDLQRLEKAEIPEDLRLPEEAAEEPMHIIGGLNNSMTWDSAEQSDLRFTIPELRFTLAVRTAAILIYEGRVLMQRTIGKNEYYLPGGHVQPLENTEETMIRELREELHSEMEIVNFAGIGELFFPWEGRTIQQLCFYYRVRFLTEKAAPGIPAEGSFSGFDTAETEYYHLEYVWVPMDQLDQIHLLPEESKQLLLDAGADAGDGAPPRRFVGIQKTI